MEAALRRILGGTPDNALSQDLQLPVPILEDTYRHLGPEL